MYPNSFFEKVKKIYGKQRKKKGTFQKKKKKKKKTKKNT